MIEKSLSAIAEWVIRFPRVVVLAWILLALASVGATIALLGLKTDQNDLIAPDLEYNRRYLDFLEEFQDLEFIYVVIQVEDQPQRAIQAAEAVAAEIELLKPAGHVQSVLCRLPLETLGFGLLFREAEELRSLVDWLERNQALLAAAAGVDRFETLVRLIAENLNVAHLAEAEPEGGPGPEQRAFAEWGFRVLSAVLAALEQSLEGVEPTPLDRLVQLELEDPLQGYLATENRKFVLVEVLPAKDTTTVELIREPLFAIRAAMDRVRQRFPDVRMGLTGRPVFQADEMMTTDRDMRRASGAALAGVFILFVLFFRRLVRPLLAIVALVAAIVLTFGIVSTTIGYLTLFTIIFTAMLVGLGIDFGIHLVARYQEELARGATAEGAIRRALPTTGLSIGTGALTTAAAFFTTTLVKVRGLQELGFIAGAGMIVCLLSMLTLLPALLLVVERRPGRRRAVRPIRIPLLGVVVTRPRLVLALLSVLTVAGIAGFRGVSYDYNLLDLQARGLESTEYERLLIKESDAGTWFAAFIVDSLEAVRDTVERLAPARTAGIVGRIESPLDVIPEDQDEKRAILAREAEAVSAIEFAPPSSELDPRRLAEALEDLLDGVDELQDGLLRRDDEESRTALRELSALAERIEKLIERLGDASVRAAEVALVQKRWLGDVQAFLGKLREALRFGPLTPETLPPILKRRFVSRDGSRFLIHAYAVKDIWQEDNMAEFVLAMRDIDPLANGTPIHFYESARLVRDGFVDAGLYALVAVFTLVFCFLGIRRPFDTLLAIAPLAVGFLWLAACLSVTGLGINLANFFAVPILIGCGVDGGIHIVHRYRETGSPADVARTTCSAVALSFLTTMVGFGAMSFASHRGVASLGQLMVMGLLCLLVASVVLLPAILAVRGARGGSPPETAETGDAH